MRRSEVRALEGRRSFVRDVFDDGAWVGTFHLADRHDQSPAHRGYESECGWCWLGASHTVDAHNASKEKRHS